jgi:hypothetical protein
LDDGIPVLSSALRVLENFITKPASGNPIIIISRRRALKFGVFLSDKERKDFLWGREIN